VIEETTLKGATVMLQRFRRHLVSLAVALATVFASSYAVYYFEPEHSDAAKQAGSAVEKEAADILASERVA
jgi:hypothetical protein